MVATVGSEDPRVHKDTVLRFHKLLYYRLQLLLLLLQITITKSSVIMISKASVYYKLLQNY